MNRRNRDISDGRRPGEWQINHGHVAEYLAFGMRQKIKPALSLRVDSNGLIVLETMPWLYCTFSFYWKKKLSRQSVPNFLYGN